MVLCSSDWANIGFSFILLPVILFRHPTVLLLGTDYNIRCFLEISISPEDLLAASFIHASDRYQDIIYLIFAIGKRSFGRGQIPSM